MAEISSKDNIGTTITQALNAGSGVDIFELATTLAEAESMPGINATTKQKEKSTVAISAYGVLKASASAYKKSFDALMDRDTLLDKTVYSQSESRVTAVISSQISAKAGTTRLQCVMLARAQQSVITRFTGSGSGKAEFTSLTQQLNGGSTVNYSIKMDSGTTALSNTVDTPQGLIDAVNAKTSVTGVRARSLVTQASGTAFTILLEGKTGANQTFEFEGHQNANTNNQLYLDKTITAKDLKVRLNDYEFVFRDNNSPTDIIDGLQLNFKSFVALDSTTRTHIVVSENTGSLEKSLDEMVTAYNNFLELSEYLTGEPDEEDELAGSLSSERSTVNMVKNRFRSTINLTSATASNGYSSLRHLGVNTKLGGKISINKTVYAEAVKSNFSDIRTMLTGDTNNQKASSLVDKGLALDASILLDTIVSDTGSIKAKETSAAAQVLKYEEQLIDLTERLDGIKARYMKQFAAMETLVQRSKNTGDYLKGQFKAMEGMYSNN